MMSDCDQVMNIYVFTRGTSSGHGCMDKEACLTAHNAKRALHQNTNPLPWSDTLAQNAKAWADSMVETKTFEHDPDNKGVEGENLFWSSSLTDVGSCAEAVEAW